MKVHKDEKIQVLLSSSDHDSLKNTILKASMKTGKLVSISSYVRSLIIDHIKEQEVGHEDTVTTKIRQKNSIENE